MENWFLVEHWRAVGRAVGVDISFPEHNSATIRNILMVLGRIIDRDFMGPCTNAKYPIFSQFDK